MISRNDTQCDLTDLDVTKLDVRKLGGLDLSRLAEVRLPAIGADVGRAAGLARDAAYAGVGVAVTTVRKVDERRRELTDEVVTQVRRIVAAVA